MTELKLSLSVKEFENLTKLLTHCAQFIDDQDIHCVEDVYQSDRVIINAYEFIEEICNIVGYKVSEDDED